MVFGPKIRFVVLHMDQDELEHWTFKTYKDAMALYNRLAIKEYIDKKFWNVRMVQIMEQNEIMEYVLRAIRGVRDYDIVASVGIKFVYTSLLTDKTDKGFVLKALVKVWE